MANSEPLSSKEFMLRYRQAELLFEKMRTRHGTPIINRNSKLVENLHTFHHELPSDIVLAGLFYQIHPIQRRKLGKGAKELLDHVDKLSDSSHDIREYLAVLEKNKIRPDALLLHAASALTALSDSNVSIEEKQHVGRIALEVHAPLFASLGLHWASQRLGNEGLKHGYPEQYAGIVASLKKGERKFERIMPAVREAVRSEAEKIGVHYETGERVKQPYSAFLKLRKYFGYGEEIDPDALLLNDAAALRLIVHGTADHCYKLLGLLRKRSDLDVKVDDDYLKRPKSNGYQSLHVLLRPHGEEYWIELQIRTRAMHARAESDESQFHWMHKLPSLPRESIRRIKVISREVGKTLNNGNRGVE